MNFELLVATNNAHKLQEIRQILTPHHILVYGMKDLNINIGEVEETGSTYYENALIKARALQAVTKMPIIADDSGLEILALNKMPGLHSARFAEECGGHANAINKILKDLESKDRSAQFVCDIVLVNVEDKPLLFEGIVPGKIGTKVEGDGGFGYDPIFICDELNKCYASLTKEEKNRISHRGKALKKLITYLKINGLCD